MTAVPEVALASVVEEQEFLLDRAQTASNRKVCACCKEALYSGLVGGAWGLGAGLAFSCLAYANSGVGAMVAVGTVANTVASATGAIFGTLVKNSLRSCGSHRVIRAICGAYGVSAFSLSLYNATVQGLRADVPLWSQFVVGAGSACIGAVACAYPRARIGRLFTGSLASAGTGVLVGITASKLLSLALPQVGPKAITLGELGALAICGYLSATEKFRDR